MTREKLGWIKEEKNEWVASSSEHDDGMHFEWKVVLRSIDEENFFSVANSTAELLPEGADEMLFRSLNDAQLFCQVCEDGSDGWSKAELLEETYKLAIKKAIKHIEVIEVDLPSKVIDALSVLNMALEDGWPTKPPCIECNAMNAEQAGEKCLCGGDKDYCHGTYLGWDS